jgi:hypothetical protein
MAGKIDLAFPGDVSSHEQFMYFRLLEQYKFKRNEPENVDCYCTIALPLPTNLGTAYASTYSNESLGMVGEMASGEAPALAEALKAGLDSNWKGGVDQLKSISARMAPSGGKELIKKLAIYHGEAAAIAGGAFVASNFMGGALAIPAGVGVNQAIKGVKAGLGIARNPYLAAVFEGVNFKSHQFSFQLTPKNAQESDTIRSIISAFRNASLPSDATITGFYDYPAQVQAAFSDDSYLFDIKTSVITAFDINYHGKGAYYHDVNGKKAPVEVSININLLETVVRLANDETTPGTVTRRTKGDKANLAAMTGGLNDGADVVRPGFGSTTLAVTT